MRTMAGSLPLLTAYAVTTGCLFLWGYWSKFDINILQYVGLLDLATSAVLPLLSAVVSIAIGSFIAPALVQKHFPAGGGADTMIGRFVGAIARFLRKHSRRLLGLYLVVALVVLPLIVDPDDASFLMPAMLFPIVVHNIHFGSVLSDVIPDDTLRPTILYLLLFIASMSFGFGRYQAVEIADGRRYLRVDSASLPESAVKGHDTKKDFKYLGHAGEYFFVLTPESSVLVVRADAVSHLLLDRKSSYMKWPPWRQ